MLFLHLPLFPGVGSILTNDSQPSVKLNLPSHFNFSKLEPNCIHGVQNCEQEVNNNVSWNLLNDKTCPQLNH